MSGSKKREWIPTDQEIRLWLQFQSSRHDIRMVAKYLETGVIDILLHKINSNEIINPLAFWLTFRLCETFYNFPTLTNAKNEYSQKIVQCIIKIVDSLIKSIKNPFINKLLRCNLNTKQKNFNLWNDKYFRYVYCLLNEKQQYRLISQLMVCSLATTCETIPISCIFLKHLILQMSDDQLKHCIIKHKYLQKIVKVLRANTRNAELFAFGVGYCAYSNIRSKWLHNGVNQCKSFHASTLFSQIIMAIMSRCVEFSEPKQIKAGGDMWFPTVVHHELTAILQRTMKTKVLGEIFKQIKFNIAESTDIIGIEWMIHLFRTFDYIDCDQKCDKKLWFFRDYLIFETDYLKIFCKMINVAKREKRIDFYKLINDISYVVARLLIRNTMRACECNFNTAHAKHITECLTKHLDLTPQEYINYLTLTLFLDCNVNQVDCFAGERKSHRTAELYDMLGVKDCLQSLFPYSNFKNYSYQCSKENKTKLNGYYRVCHAILLHRHSHGLQRRFLQNRHIDCYGVGFFGPNIGNFGILYYAICNVENLMLLFQPNNRQCVRNVRTSMIMFAQHITAKNKCCNSIQWNILMKDICSIYSFYNINIDKLNIPIDRDKLNANYHFVSEYIRRFVINMTQSPNSTPGSRFWHIENRINYILAISYAFLGELDAYYYRDKLLAAEDDDVKFNSNNVNLMIQYALKNDCKSNNHNKWQKQSLQHLQHIIADDKKQSNKLHRNNLISMGYVNQNKHFLNQVLNEKTRDEELYSEWKGVTCVKTCNVCRKHRPKMYRCKNCKLQLYCSKRCQKIDWNTRIHSCVNKI